MVQGLGAKDQRPFPTVGSGPGSQSLPAAAPCQLTPDPQAFSSTFLITSTISGPLVILNTSICLQKASGLCFLRGNNVTCTRLSSVTNTRKSQGISTLLRVRVPQIEQMLCSLGGSKHIFEASPKKWNNEMIVHLIFLLPIDALHYATSFSSAAIRWHGGLKDCSTTAPKSPS